MKVTLTYADHPFLAKPGEVVPMEGVAYAYIMFRLKNGTHATIPCHELSKIEFEMSIGEIEVSRQIMKATLAAIERVRSAAAKDGSDISNESIVRSLDEIKKNLL